MSLFGPPDVVKLKTKRNLGGLIKALGYQKEVTVRRDAALALGDIGDSHAAQALAKALMDIDNSVRVAATQALLELVNRTDKSTNEMAIQVLRRIDPDWFKSEMGQGSIPVLIGALDILTTQRISPGILSLELLSKIGEAAVVPLLESPNTGKYLSGKARALGLIGGTRAISPLLLLLKSNEFGTRDEAAKSLLNINRSWWKTDDARVLVPELIDMLSGFLSSESWEHGRDVVATILGEIGDIQATEPLIDALKRVINKRRHEYGLMFESGGYNSSTQEMGIAIANSLGKIGDPRALKTLIRVLSSSDRNDGIEASIASAIESFGSASIELLVTQLIPLNKSWGANKHAASILTRLRWQPITREQRSLLAVVQERWKDAAAEGLTAMIPLTIRLSNGWSSYIAEALQVAIGCKEISGNDNIQNWKMIIETIATKGEVGLKLLLLMHDGYWNFDEEERQVVTNILESNFQKAEPFFPLLKDECIRMRTAAFRFLESIGWHPVNDEQRVVEAITYFKSDKLVAIGNIAIAPLLALIAQNEYQSMAWRETLEIIVAQDVTNIDTETIHAIIENDNLDIRYDGSRLKQIAQQELLRRAQNA